MIYHFCNTAFGQHFQVLAADFGRRFDVPITTVMSQRPARPGGKSRLPPAGELDRPGPIIVADVNVLEFVERIEPGDHGIVTGFNQIFAQRTIDRFASLVNFHASVLPFYRGPTPTYWCIRNGERMTGFTLHEVIAKIDAGPVLHQEIVPINGVRDPAALGRRIANAAGATFVRYLEHIRTGSPWEIQVVDAGALYTTPVNYLSFPP